MDFVNYVVAEVMVVGMEEEMAEVMLAVAMVVAKAVAMAEETEVVKAQGVMAVERA